MRRSSDVSAGTLPEVNSIIRGEVIASFSIEKIVIPIKTGRVPRALIEYDPVIGLNNLIEVWNICNEMWKGRNVHWLPYEEWI